MVIPVEPSSPCGARTQTARESAAVTVAGDLCHTWGLPLGVSARTAGDPGDMELQNRKIALAAAKASTTAGNVAARISGPRFPVGRTAGGR